MIEMDLQTFAVVWQTQWGHTGTRTITNFGFFRAKTKKSARRLAHEEWGVQPEALTAYTVDEVGSAFYKHLKVEKEEAA